MDAGCGGGRKKIRGCGLLSLLYRSHRRSPLTSSVPHGNSPPPSSPVKALQPTSGRRHGGSHKLVIHNQVAVPKKQQHVPTLGNGLSGELESLIVDHQKADGSSKLVGASSGNVTLNRNLGNVWGSNHSMRRNLMVSTENSMNGVNGVMGNIVNKKDENMASALVVRKSLSKRMGPEILKMGNKEPNTGKFVKLMEVAGECKRTVEINSSYYKAHHRLATVYLRLGEPEKAVHHYKLSRKEADSADISRAKNLEMHILCCGEARKLKDWKTMLKESQSGISGGADSAPKIFALKAEALLRLGKQEEADSVLKTSPKFEADSMINLFGDAVNGYVLIIQAQVDMASGRFSEAVAVARRAAEVDRNNPEIIDVLRRMIAIASARQKGNELFKDTKFAEACTAYGEGLDVDPQNAILLCNRAACCWKLGHWEKAVDECSIALSLRPSYVKARMRRADCYAKLGKWEASIRDYEELIRQIPGDGEVVKRLAEARSLLQKKRNEVVKEMTWC